MTLRVAAAIVLLSCAIVPAARAQEPPPPLPLIALDLHGSFANLPSDDRELAASRGLIAGELPGRAFGGDLGLHLYPLRVRAVTFGIGGQLTFVRAHHAPPATTATALLRPVTARFVSGGAQVSFNFGSGDGWSYLSGGIGRSVWQIIPDGAEPQASDEEKLKTINYGGGARWFIKRRLAFSVDVRFHAVNPGTPAFGFNGSPRTTLMVVGAGVTLK